MLSSTIWYSAASKSAQTSSSPFAYWYNPPSCSHVRTFSPASAETLKPAIFPVAISVVFPSMESKCRLRSVSVSNWLSSSQMYAMPLFPTAKSAMQFWSASSWTACCHCPLRYCAIQISLVVFWPKTSSVSLFAIHAAVKTPSTSPRRGSAWYFSPSSSLGESAAMPLNVWVAGSNTAALIVCAFAYSERSWLLSSSKTLLLSW